MNNKTTKFKSIVLSLGAVMGMALFATSALRAGDQDFTLVNKTGVEIHSLHVSPHSSDSWEEDILGKDTLPDGESVEITFGSKDKAHHWDLRVEDGKGNVLTWENLDLTTISELTLHYKDGKAWADVK
jgi:hypothetical protein